VALHDRLARPLTSLRLSVTDRCNLRCQYCMPEPDYVWLPREDILHFEEIVRLTRLFVGLGVSRVRLTGGEPLLRRNVPELVRQLSDVQGIDDLALTTNGVLLPDLAADLRAAGLGRITVSLDTLDRARFRAITRMDELPRVLRGIEAARETFDGPLKLDAVIIRGTNDDELGALLDFARERGAEIRFIEYMDVGGATRWSTDLVVTRDEILERIAMTHGRPAPTAKDGWAPADRFVLEDGTTFGVISSTTAPFCRTCDRSRLTADGLWLLCLYAREGTNVRTLVRNGASDEEITRVLSAAWLVREDRGAERRLEATSRGALIPLVRLKENPHLEMHTRGG
jgi:cyclic pyranopterin phosphate synthase